MTCIIDRRWHGNHDKVGFLQGTGFQNTQQADGTYYSPAGDSQTIDAFLGAPRTYGVTLRVKY